MRTLFSKSAKPKSRMRVVRFAREEGPLAGIHRPSTGFQWLKIDKTLAFITFVFICFGLVFTYSSSAFDSTSYFQRQLIFDAVGIVAALFLSQTYARLQSYVKPIWLMYGTWVLLIIVLFTEPIANVHRWIKIGPFNLQPSEVAKVTFVIYIADYLSRYQGKLSKNWRLLAKPVVVTGITFALIMRAPDLGTPILMGTVFALLLLVAGTNIKYLACMAAGAIPIVLYQLIFYPYRLKRLLSFLDPEAQAAGDGYQVFRSFMAVGSGGWFGKGFGNSELKLEYLPAAHTDFIFSIMCEEFGLVGATVLIAFFCWLLIRGVSLARVAKNSFHSLLIFGLTMTICLQAFFNMSMAIGIVPPKGIPLPFFSYGGSSVIMTLVMVGMIANLAAGGNAPAHQTEEDFTDYRNRNK